MKKEEKRREEKAATGAQIVEDAKRLIEGIKNKASEEFFALDPDDPDYDDKADEIFRRKKKELESESAQLAYSIIKWSTTAQGAIALEVEQDML